VDEVKAEDAVALADIEDIGRPPGRRTPRKKT